MKRAATSKEAREIAHKVERDMQAAAGVAVRMTSLGVRLVVTPKVELAKKLLREFVRALDEE
jgi:hypothetical protein